MEYNTPINKQKQHERMGQLYMCCYGKSSVIYCKDKKQGSKNSVYSMASFV